MTDFSRLKYYEPSKSTGQPLSIHVDLCIYGSTPAGIAAALQGKRMGLRVAIASFGDQSAG